MEQNSSSPLAFLARRGRFRSARVPSPFVGDKTPTRANLTPGPCFLKRAILQGVELRKRPSQKEPLLVRYQRRGKKSVTTPPPPQPSPTRGEGALFLPPPWWGRGGVGGNGAQFNRAQYNTPCSPADTGGFTPPLA